MVSSSYLLFSLGPPGDAPVEATSLFSNFFVVNVELSWVVLYVDGYQEEDGKMSGVLIMRTKRLLILILTSNIFYAALISIVYKGGTSSSYKTRSQKIIWTAAEISLCQVKTSIIFNARVT